MWPISKLKRLISQVLFFINKINNIERAIKKEIQTSNYRTSAMQSVQVGIRPYKKNEINVVVSLTTYSKRIHSVYLTIESILNQTMYPNKVILWLDENEFSLDNLPNILHLQMKRGLEIGFCQNIKSYKKLIPTLEKHADDIIITIDDDVIYPCDFIERLYKTNQKEKNCVCYYRGHKIKFLDNYTLAPYNEWQHQNKDCEKRNDILPTGIGGILYPPGCFHEDVGNSQLFMKLAPRGDDIWFKAMTMLNGVETLRVDADIKFEDDFIEIDGTQDIALWKSNVGQNENDKQIKAVFDYYSDLIYKFKSSNVEEIEQSAQ